MLKRIIFTLLLSGKLSFLLTLWVTFINIGFVEGFLSKWKMAFLAAWPVAALAAFFVAPAAAKLTDWLLKKRTKT